MTTNSGFTVLSINNTPSAWPVLTCHPVVEQARGDEGGWVEVCQEAPDVVYRGERQDQGGRAVCLRGARREGWHRVVILQLTL